MASIANDPNGRRRILFVGADGKRRTLRLGKASLRHAESIKVRIEDMVSANIDAPLRTLQQGTFPRNLAQLAVDTRFM